MSFWEQIGALAVLLTIWSVILLWAVKVLLDRSQKHTDRQFKNLQKEIKDASNETKSVGAELAAFKTEVAREYVARGDWVRFGTAISAKVDAVHARIDILLERKHAN